MNRTISLIIPVYNSSTTIIETLKSVVNQSKSVDEIIIVDDGSTDDTCEVINSFFMGLESKTNYLLISQENRRQGAARNTGFDATSGDYVIFLDADDYWSLNLIELLSNEIHRSDSPDLILFSYQRVDSSGKVIKQYILDEKIIKGLNNDTGIKFQMPASPCFHIANRDYLIRNEIRFTESISFEDIDYMGKIVTTAKSASFINYVGYNYLIRQESTVRGKDALHNLDVIESFKSLNTFLISKGMEKKYIDNIQDLAVRYLFVDASIRTIVSISSYKEKKEVLRLIRAYMDNTYPGFSNNNVISILSFPKKIIYYLLKFKMYYLLNILLGKVVL